MTRILLLRSQVVKDDTEAALAAAASVVVTGVVLEVDITHVPSACGNASRTMIKANKRLSDLFPRFRNLTYSQIMCCFSKGLALLTNKCVFPGIFPGLILGFQE